MTALFSQNKTYEPGIIILGNAGAGKSHICNMLIGHNRFEAEFQPEAVTTVTEHHRITLGSNSFKIFNIPGLVEVNQEHIDRNKREIMKAFEESPTSVVLFVWTQIGGRVQNDDVIAFNALNNAYKFPTGSLLFIVNNIPLKRPHDYEAKFITILSNMLKPVQVSLKDTLFIDTMDPEDYGKINQVRSNLIFFINDHHASLQHRNNDIIVESKELNKMRELLKQQQLQAEKDRTAFQNQIAKMANEYRIAKEEDMKRYQLMQTELQSVKTLAENDRVAQANERRNWERQEREREQRYQEQIATRAEERRNWERQEREREQRYQQQIAARAEEQRNWERQQQVQAEERRNWERQEREREQRYQQQIASHAEERQNWERRQRQREQEEKNQSRRDSPFDVFGDIVAAPVNTVRGAVTGTATGFNTVVDPLAEYIDDSDNNIILRGAAIPVAVVGGTLGAVTGAVGGAVTGALRGVGRIFTGGKS